MDPTDAVFAILLAAICPYAILAGFSARLYKNVGRGLLSIPLIVTAFGMFAVSARASDNNGFGQMTASGIVYLSIFLGVAMLGAYALFAVVNRKLNNAPTMTED